MVAITDVTSRTGSLLASQLLKAGEKVRGIDISRAKMSQLISDGLDGAEGDISDPVFLTSGLRDVKTLFLIMPLSPDRDEYKRMFIDVANSVVKSIRDSGVRTIFFFSAMGADEKEESGLLSSFSDVEEILETLSLENLYFIRPGYYMDHLLKKITSIRNQDRVEDCINGETPLYFVDKKDIAVKVAEMYLGGSYYGRSKFEMYSDKVSLREAVKMIGQEIGIPELPFVQLSDQEYRNKLLEQGSSMYFANSYVEMAHAISRGAMSPTLIDPNNPNCPTRLIDFVKKVFVNSYHCGEE